MPKEILTIQEEENGEFTYEIPELGIIDTATTAKVALKDATDRIKIAKENPLERRGELQSRLVEINSEAESVVAELKGLEIAIATNGEPIEAIELLEQIPMAEKYIRWFMIDHPMEQIFGDVKCIGFGIGRDKDNDGDLDVEPILHSRRTIKR